MSDTFSYYEFFIYAHINYIASELMAFSAFVDFCAFSLDQTVDVLL
jgi:hypothetical protein